MTDTRFAVKAYGDHQWISEGFYPEEVARKIFDLLVTTDLEVQQPSEIRITLEGPERRGTTRKLLSEYRRGMENR